MAFPNETGGFGKRTTILSLFCNTIVRRWAPDIAVETRIRRRIRASIPHNA